MDERMMMNELGQPSLDSLGLPDSRENAIDRGRIRKAVLNDIQRVNSFFTSETQKN